MADDRYLDKQQTAQYLSISRRLLDRMDADRSPDRTFPRCIRIAGRKRWLKSAIEDWAAAQIDA